MRAEPDPTATALAPSVPGRVAARLARQVEVGVASVDLSVPQYRVLMLLDEGDAAASKLADHLAVTRPSVTAVVDGLVARGLVERRNDPDDRRRVGHRLTGAGRDLLAAADRQVEARLREIASHLPDAGGPEEAMQGLECWQRALDRYRAAKKERKA